MYVDKIWDSERYHKQRVPCASPGKAIEKNAAVGAAVNFCRELKKCKYMSFMNKLTMYIVL